MTCVVNRGLGFSSTIHGALNGVRDPQWVSLPPTNPLGMPSKPSADGTSLPFPGRTRATPSLRRYARLPAGTSAVRFVSLR
jgi:hypothetical protein